ncbi:hypothetical protein [Streptomyces sp. SID3343]|uniref:hypothetical protein n=1 Tax=Streptomyces sp. SID3343 TaxID=2690260 RepID=UPI00136BAF59|nr:hypothetical protein [Streptomyces sp. SID3343]MYV98924.1 hypothetical protein [Streptomyces sp. SID3343]
MYEGVLGVGHYLSGLWWRDEVDVVCEDGTVERMAVPYCVVLGHYRTGDGELRYRVRTAARGEPVRLLDVAAGDVRKRRCPGG